MPLTARSLLAPITAFSAHRDLVLGLARRDILTRYQGSIFGLAWGLFTPVLMLGIYTFFFTGVFNARWSGGTGSKTEYALKVFAALVPYLMFLDCLNRAPATIVSVPNFVKRIAFPVEIQAWVLVLSSLFHAALMSAVFLAFVVIVGHPVPWTWVLLPLAFLPLVLAGLGLGWLLGSLGVYFRDISQAVGLVSTLLFFISPIFYPLEALPEQWRWLFFANPLTYLISLFRAVTIEGVVPEPGPYLLALGCAWAFSLGALFVFRRVKSGFADVL